MTPHIPSTLHHVKSLLQTDGKLLLNYLSKVTRCLCRRLRTGTVHSTDKPQYLAGMRKDGFPVVPYCCIRRNEHVDALIVSWTCFTNMRSRDGTTHQPFNSFFILNTSSLVQRTWNLGQRLYNTTYR